MREDKEFRIMDNVKIGKLIAKRRKNRGLTQSQLAETLGVSNKTVSKWETGAGLPDISLLIDLADALHISIDDLLKANDVQEDTFEFEHIFKIEKAYYRKYLYDQYFCHQTYWIMDLCAIMMILAGIAAFPLNVYVSEYMTLLAKVSLMLGIVLLSIPVLIMIYHIKIFHPVEVYYAFKNDKIIYLHDGEEITYDLQQFCLIKRKKFAYLKNDKKILWLALDDVATVKPFVQNDNPKTMKCRFLGKLFFAVVLASVIILQLGYTVVLKSFGFEYIHDQYEMLLYFVILWASVSLWMMIRKSGRQMLIYMITSIIVLFLINVLLKSNSSIHTIASFSPDFQHRAVLKYDSFHEDLSDYHYTYLCFAKKTETVHISKMIENKGYWLTNDCYLLTYRDLQQNQDVYVSTFGDRGNGISYYSVTAALQGNWYQTDNDKSPFTLKVENGKITVKHDETSVFSGNEIVQNGTIALTLYKNDHPQYVIALDENCYLEDNGILNKKGTITIVDLNDFSSGTLYCGTYKEDQEEQEEIDEKMRDSTVKLINEMNELLQDDPQLKNMENSYRLFKVETDSNDYFTVSKEAYFMHRTLFTDNSMMEKGQIINIKIIAGDIQDFYVEMSMEETVKGQGETETTGTIGAHYRIKKGKNCYLVANITYRMPGSIGLKENDPVIEKDTANDLNYAY